MSLDIEHYAQIYASLGDMDIQQVLLRAANMSRERGRPDVMFLDTQSEKFQEDKERIQKEVLYRKTIQRQVTDFFLERAPLKSRASLVTVTSEFNQVIGRKLSDETQTSYLLLPQATRYRSQRDPDDLSLLEKTRRISPQLKIAYNRGIRAALRANLRRIGDIRTSLVLSPEDVAKGNSVSQTGIFLSQAFVVQ